MNYLRILFFGDVVGAIGRQALVKVLPELKKKFNPDLTIANAENLAHGSGVTEQTLNELIRAGSGRIYRRKSLMEQPSRRSDLHGSFMDKSNYRANKLRRSSRR